jgi:DegV family protein with EDD domain
VAKIAVVTDSVACIPYDLLKRYDIRVAPVHIIWDKVPYRDGIDISIEGFYKRLRTSKKLPTTSSAIQGEYIGIYEGLRGKVDGIVTIVLSGELGASYNSACTAREVVGGVNVEVIDTRTALMGQGFVVLEAAKVAMAGGTMEEIAQTARSMIPRVSVLYTMDTLEYLRRGGRVSMPQAIFASWLKVKPILTFEGGKVAPLSRARTRPRALDRLLDLMEEKINDASPLHVAVLHGDAPQDAEKLKQRVAERFRCSEILISEITPVIGTHTGPGTLGFAYYQE